MHDKRNAIALLLSHRGTDLAINSRNHGGNTALHALAWRGNLALVQALLDYPHERVNVNAVNAFNGTPLFVACTYGHTAVAARLLRMPGVMLDVQSCDKAVSVCKCVRAFAKQGE